MTDISLFLIPKALDLSTHDHCMFWPACTLGYFGFLRSAEFTVPNLASFSPTTHLSVADITVDSTVAASCIRLRMKASKTGPFWAGCYVYIGGRTTPLCAVQAMLAYLSLRGNVPGALFLQSNGQPLTRILLAADPFDSWDLWELLNPQLSHRCSYCCSSNGVPGHLIQVLGRWTSNAYQLCFHTY